jgi:hypothetical protein
MLRPAASVELHAAVERGDVGTIERLVAEGTSVNEPHEVCERAMREAALEFSSAGGGEERAHRAPSALHASR